MSGESLLLDESVVLKLLLDLMGEENGEEVGESHMESGSRSNTSSNMSEDETNLLEDSDAGNHTEAESSRIDAGCQLWDLAITLGYAEMMINNGAFAIISGVLQSFSLISFPPLSESAQSKPPVPSARLQEVSIGIVGNIACHSALRKTIIEDQSLCLAIFGVINTCEDPAALTEVFRLLSALFDESDCDSLWYQMSTSMETISFSTFVIQNTLDDMLCLRASEWLYLLVYTHPSAVDPNASREIVESLKKLLDERMASLHQVSVEGVCCLDYVLRCAETCLHSQRDKKELSVPYFDVENGTLLSFVGIILVILIDGPEYPDAVQESSIHLISEIFKWDTLKDAMIQKCMNVSTIPKIFDSFWNIFERFLCENSHVSPLPIKAIAILISLGTSKLVDQLGEITKDNIILPSNDRSNQQKQVSRNPCVKTAIRSKLYVHPLQKYSEFLLKHAMPSSEASVAKEKRECCLSHLIHISEICSCFLEVLKKADQTIDFFIPLLDNQHDSQKEKLKLKVRECELLWEKLRSSTNQRTNNK